MKLEILINDDIKSAMLAKDKEKLEALRAIKSALLLAKTGKDVTSGEIPAEVEVQLLQRLLKQRRESAAIYQAQNRNDLAEVELFQASIIEKYLPEQMSEEEIKGIIAGIITQTGATGIKDMGRVMGLATKQLSGKAENKVVADLIKHMLGA